eukprot:TRINITY_DN796_c0_g1_i1.p1 TRINITY_DN796_c0_g1~~TRINITY_DN796_c0_g1_i1.p1  ORF type:complete len:387 (-),score=52.46 TRINITY_DN796_c0_g1_i1:197-1357(-)
MGSSASLRKKKRSSETAHARSMTKRKRTHTSSEIEPHLLQVLTGSDTPKAKEPIPLDQRPVLQIAAEKRTEDKTRSNAGDVGSSSAKEENSDHQGDNQVTKTNQADDRTRNQIPVPHETRKRKHPENGVQSNSEPPRRELPPPLPPDHVSKIKVTVLLQNANLETVKQSGRAGGFVLLNCDDHRHLLQKTGRNANDARPDITHQCLLTLLDSPLNKEGRLKIYIRTAKNVLIDVHQETRIPRTMKRFSGLMAELLEKLKVRGTSGSTPLLKVIRNPIASHLPVGTRKIVCTYNTENVIDIREHANAIADMVVPTARRGLHLKDNEHFNIAENGEDVNVLYVVGAMAHGKVVEDWADDYICISEYPLSAANVCGRITNAYENLFGIL